MAIRCLMLAMMLLTPGIVWAEGKPVILFKTTEVGAGQVYYGDKASFEFEFTNAGDAPLVVERVRTSCGCTKAESDPKSVSPGGKGRIQVTYDSHGQPRGAHDKGITVYSNDPAKPKVDLKFKVDVVRELEVQPESVAKVVAKFSSEIPITFELSNHSGPGDHLARPEDVRRSGKGRYPRSSAGRTQKHCESHVDSQAPGESRLTLLHGQDRHRHGPSP